MVEPSLTLVVAPVSVTVGATLLTVTVWVAVLLLASSESLTWTETVLEAGPSGKVQSKLPPGGGRGRRADLAAVAAAADRDDAERVHARIADGEAVGVCRALVDRRR